MQRNASEIEHRQDVGVSHLVLQRESNDIKVPERRVALKRKQRYLTLAKLRFHVGPRRVDSLGGPAFVLVEKTVKDLEAEVAHADFVGIRKAQSYPSRDIFRRFVNGVPFTADIARGLLH